MSPHHDAGEEAPRLPGQRPKPARLPRALAVGLPAVSIILAALPASAQDLSAIRREMQQMRQQYESELDRLRHDYEARLKKMEDRLEAAETQAQAATSKAEDAQKAAEVAQQAPPPAAPAAATAPASAGAFNPAIGAVLDGKFASLGRNPNNYRLPGIALGEEAKPPPRGFSLGESEVNFSANIDQALYGNLTLAFQRENTVSVEEAFIQPTALPYGFTVKAGRFFSGIGYINEQHAHTWDFADQTLPYRAFLNNQYDDDGLQVRWLAPTDRFLEFGGEAFRGDAFPASGTANHNQGVGAWSAFVHAGDDIGDSASYRVGLSHLWTKAKNRTTTSLNGIDSFTGTDHTYIADGTFKWAPHGNFADRYVKLQGEFFLRQEAGGFTPAGALAAQHLSGTQTGFYVQSIYQFMPQWRVGLRYDQVHAPSLGPGFAGTTLDTLGATPRRYGAMADYSTSEFGRFRVQYNLDQSRPQTDHEFILQYTVSIGAHGAHNY